MRKQVTGKTLSGSLANAVSASGRLFTVCMVLGVMRSFMENLGLNRFQAVLDQVSHNHVSVMTVAVYGGLTVGACVIAYLNEIPKTKLRQGIYYHFKLEAMKKATLVDFSSAKSYGTGALLQRIEAGASAGRQMVCDF